MSPKIVAKTLRHAEIAFKHGKAELSRQLFVEAYSNYPEDRAGRLETMEWMRIYGCGQQIDDEEFAS